MEAKEHIRDGLLTQYPEKLPVLLTYMAGDFQCDHSQSCSTEWRQSTGRRHGSLPNWQNFFKSSMAMEVSDPD